MLYVGLGEADAETLAAPREGDQGGDGWLNIGDPERGQDVLDVPGSSGCLLLDGTSGLSLEQLPTTEKSNIGLEAWVRPVSVGGSRCIVKLGGDGGFGIEQQKDGVWGVIYGKATVGFGKLPEDRWTHVALVVFENSSTLYINGKPAGSADATPWGYKQNTGVTIGIRDDENGGFDGSIDEVRVFTFEPDAFSAEDLLTTN